MATLIAASQAFQNLSSKQLPSSGSENSDIKIVEFKYGKFVIFEKILENHINFLLLTINSVLAFDALRHNIELNFVPPHVRRLFNDHGPLHIDIGVAASFLESHSLVDAV